MRTQRNKVVVSINIAAVVAFLAPACAALAEDRTLDQPEVVVSRIGIAGCHRQDNPAPAIWRYVAAKPDLMMWIGDNVYADTEDDISYLVKQHEMLASLPAFQELRKSTQIASTWDDHDYGLNNYGKTYALKEESKQFFRKFWGIEDLVPADGDGIYHTKTYGPPGKRLQVILLDGRFNRDDEGDNSDTLGEPQWAWLEAQLRKPADLRLLVNGYQFLIDRDQEMETWSKFPAAQKRLLALIRETGAEGLVFVAGDQHYGEITRRKGAIGYDAIELMFCGINQEEPHVYNSGRVSPVAHAKNSYALVDVQWEKSERDEPHLVFRALDADRDAVELTYRINFSELKKQADDRGPY